MANYIRIIAVILCMAIFLWGCVKQPTDQDIQEESRPDKEEEVFLTDRDLSLNYQTILMTNELLEMKCLPTKEVIYIVGVRQGADGFSTETVIYRLDEGTLEPVEFAVFEQEKLLSWCSDESGRIAMISVKVDSYTMEKNYLLHLLDTEEGRIDTYSLKNIFEKEKEFGSFTAMALEGTELCVADSMSRRVYIFDYKADSMKQSYDMEILPEYLSHAQDMFWGMSSTGKVYAFNSDIGSKQEKASKIFDDISYIYNSITDGDNVWAITKDGLYEVEIQSGKSEQVIDYLEYDILPQDYMMLYEESEADVWKIVTWGQTSKQVEIFSLKPLEKDEVKKEKEIVTLSVYSVDEQLREAVVAFNKSNSEYRVEIIAGEDGVTYNEFFDREQIELSTGKGPDIFTKTGNMMFTNYIDKGFVEDLMPYIERDLVTEDYVESSLYAYEQNGSIYAIESEFTINFMITNGELFEGDKNWTFKEMAAVMKQNSEIASFSDWGDASEVLRICVGLGGIKATDYETVEECISFAKQYGKILSEGERIVLGKNVLVKEVQINEALDWADIQLQYGENIVPVGYPRDNRQGIRHSSRGWSINANSSNKEGAWEFLKFLLSEEYQKQVESGFSPLREIFEEQLERYLSPMAYNVYLPEAGGVVTIKNSYTLPGSGEQIECMTKEQIATVNELVKKSDSFVFSMNYDVWSIIQEEAAAYFSDQRDLVDVMKNIQNRVNLYMEEKE